MKKNLFLVILCISVILFIISSFSNLGAGRKGGVEEDKDAGCGCLTDSSSGQFDYSETRAFFEGEEIDISHLAFNEDQEAVLGVASEERWIEVDLSDQKLFAWEGDNLFLETLVSTGLPWFPTPTGEFHVWIKLKAAKMEGGSGRLYYYLPNVPYIMYFENAEIPGWRGYGLHGTYWHSDFGTQRSHGCVNLPTEIAKELFYWTVPVVPEGKGMVKVDGQLGTRIVIHD